MDPNLQIKSSPGCKDVLLRKLSYAVTTSIASQIVILAIFLFVMNFNVFHPLKWLTSTWATLTSFSTWIFVIPFLSIIFAQSLICAKDYVLKSSSRTSRIQKIISAFSLRNIVLLGLHIFSGGLLTWLYVSLVGDQYGNLFVPCKKELTCLNTNTFYLIFCGLWSGLYFFVRVYRIEKQLSFPAIYQPKLLHFKSRLIPLLKESQKCAFWPTSYFLILYFIWGHTVKTYINDLLNLEVSNIPFSFTTVLLSWIYTSIYMFVMNLMRFFFELYLTEPIEFPILGVNQNDLTLSHALCISNIPIIQHLASYDLFSISRNYADKRKVLFMLSQPGNHPHNWNTLTTNTLTLISDYTMTLNSSINAILNTEPDKKVDIPLAKPNVPIPHNYIHNIRSLGLHNVQAPLNIVNVSQSNNVPLSSPMYSLVNYITGRIKAFLTATRTKFGSNFFFRRLPLEDIQCCLESGQIIIWITQALSNLAIASLKEDSFGVVQKDLPIILSTLVDLKQGIEKLNRIPTFTRKAHTTDDFYIKMKSAISSSVKRSLYNISKNFGRYISDIPLKKEVLQCLQPYLAES